MVEICKSYKYLIIFDTSWGFLILNSLNFFRVYTNVFNRDD